MSRYKLLFLVGIILIGGFINLLNAQIQDQSAIDSWLENYGNGNPAYAVVGTTVQVTLTYGVYTGPYALVSASVDYSQFGGPANIPMSYNSVNHLWQGSYLVQPGSLVDVLARVIVKAYYANGGSTIMPDDVYFTVNNIPQPSVVSITSQPSGADVFLDGAAFGQTPCSAPIVYGQTLLISVEYELYIFEPASQLVNWHYLPQTVSFTGTLPGTNIDPDNIPSLWTAENSPYNISGPLQIPADQTVTITPGTVVYMVTPDAITVLGTMHAQEAVFSSLWDSSFWAGLKLVGSSDRQESSFYGCLIRNAVNGFELVDSSPQISDCVLLPADSTLILPGKGIGISGATSVQLTNLQINNYELGIHLLNQDRSLATPQLTNLNLRSISSATNTTGIKLEGMFVAVMDSLQILNYGNGIEIMGANNSSATLTNVRIRNTSSNIRTETKGAVLQNLGSLSLHDAEIDGFTTGLMLSNPERTLTANSTLTNVRIRNTSSVIRPENVGMVLGTGIAGFAENCLIENARIGIKIEDGNQTKLSQNKILNCETGIQLSSSSPSKAITHNLFVLEPYFASQHPDFSFKALKISQSGPHLVQNNTISGYPKALAAENANLTFSNNIAWNSTPIAQPFSLLVSSLQQSYNNIRWQFGVFPGMGNLNADPLFLSPSTGDFSLHYNSPCIDTGNPDFLDVDGSRSDMGAFCYLHNAAFADQIRFIPLGQTLQVTNLSLGHNHPESSYAWDLNADGSVEFTSRDFVYQFDIPGFYNLKLSQQTGNLTDEKTAYGLIVVQAENYLPPQNLQLSKQGNNIQLSWQPVTHNAQNQPLQNPVNYYLIYQSSDPYGVFSFAGFTEGGQTSWQTPFQDRQFFFVIAFSGSREQLLRFLQAKPSMEAQP